MTMTSTIRSLFIGMVLGFASLQVSQAATEGETPDVTMQQLTQKIFARLEEKEAFMRSNPDQVHTVGRELVDEFVLPHLDMNLMSRWIVGKSWRSATAEQRERFQAEFTNMLIRTYANALLEFRGKEMVFQPFHHDPKRKDAVVKAAFKGGDGAPPVPVLFRVLRNGEGVWKVIDIIVDGVSLVKNYRSSFGAEIRKVGLDGLIKRLSSHNKGQKEG